MKNNILIVCRSFAPDSIVGAKRLSMFAKYLNINGYNVTVVRSGDIHGKPDKSTVIEQNARLRFISYNGENSKADRYEKNPIEYKISKNSIKKQNKIICFLKKRCYFLKNIRDFIYYYYDNIKVYVKSKKVINDLLKKEKFDVVITTYSPLGSTLCGRYIQKKYNIPWIMDLRDLMDNVGRTPLMRRINRRIQRKLSIEANKITTPTKGFSKEIAGVCKNSDKVITLYNGYEKNSISNDNKKDNILRFCYTGTIHDDLCTLEPIFSALNDLIQENKVNPQNICFNYAGKDSDRFLFMAENCGAKEYCVDNGYITHGEAIKLQSDSDIFVLMVMNLKDYQGVLTGKLCESMQNQMPVIGLVSGDVPESELKQTIETYNLGFCFEEIQRSILYKKLKDYILIQYNNKQENRVVEYTPNVKCYDEFVYENQILKLINIIEEI